MRSNNESPLPVARVCGPKITANGFEENASTGTLKLITAIQKIGNTASKHQKKAGAGREVGFPSSPLLVITPGAA